MPIASGQMGRPGVLALPGDRFLRGHPFRSRPFSTKNPTVSGVTQDSSGAPLGSCVVRLLRTSNDELVSTSTSDGSGNYALIAIGSGPFYVVAYKAGATDVSGTTVNTLIGT